MDKLKILRDYEPLIKKAIKTYLIDKGFYEDALQEGYAVVLKCLKNFDSKRGTYFPGYVKMAVIYTIKNFSYKNRNNPLSLDKIAIGGSDSIIDFIEDDIDIEEDYLKFLERKNLKAALSKLNNKELELILDFYFKGKTIKEISKCKRCHYMTIVKRKEKILKKLKELLDDNKVIL